VSQISSHSLVRQFESLFDAGCVAGLPDRQLLDRFTTARDSAGEAAFAALVSRHGPMVFSLCRQLLVDEHHAEDAFQAVFLVLARKAGSIRDPDLLGNWLYGVALRTARNARLRMARRRQSEEGSAVGVAECRSGTAAVHEPPDHSTVSREEAEVLHEEIDRLPGSFRLPVVLCYFEGLTLEEASRRLQWPVGTVGSRLARARQKLRRKLARRGVVSSMAIAAVLSPRSSRAAGSSQLCHATARAAVDAAARASVSSSAESLAQEVLRTMLIHKLRHVSTGALIAAALVLGAGILSQSLPARERRPEAQSDQPASAAIKSDDARTGPKPGRMTVVGRVLDPAGKPVVHATVELVGRPRRVITRGNWLGSLVLVGRGETDSDGRFRLDALRTSSVRFFFLYALVKAPVLGWAELDPDAQQPEVEIRLRPEHLIRGKLVDVNGEPAAGVVLTPEHFGQTAGIGQTAEMMLDDPPKDLRTGLDSVKTDDQGRFVLNSLGRGLDVGLKIDDPRYAPQTLRVAAGNREGPTEVTLTLAPARTVEGRVLTADTGRPLAGTIVSIPPSRVRTDADGRFRANVATGDRFGVLAYPPEGQPYLIAANEAVWEKGQVKKQIDITLSRGVVIRGKVTEQGTGRPLSGSSILFVPVKGPAGIESKWDSIVPSAENGVFQIVVPPGNGHLLVFGPTGDYVHEVIGRRELMEGISGGERWYAHDIIPYMVQSGALPQSINAELRPGKVVRGRVVGTDGQPVADAVIITRLHIEPVNPFWVGGWSYQHRVRDGYFELHGLDLEKPVVVYFLDAEHERGAAVELSGKQSDTELTVRLEPSGQAHARFLGRDGKPVVGYFPNNLELVITPAPPAFRRDASDPSGLADELTLAAAIDRKHYGRAVRPVTDADGRVVFPALIPGALYRLYVRGSDGRPSRKDFTVKPGESLELGDIPI
jgi:RNA polymerase sigma factor (sigma-70 family)